MRGHAATEFARPIIATYEHSPSTESIDLYFDLQAVKSYDSLLAARISARLLPDRHRVTTHILLRTPHLTMGFGIVGITLGSAFRKHTERKPFNDALAQTLAARGAIHFPLETLDTLSKSD